MAFSEDSACSICEAKDTQVVAVNWCPECEEALCANCLEHHSISKATKTHKSFAVGDYKGLPAFILAIKPSCAEHDDRYQHYCVNHDVPLCPKCVITNHRECKDVKTLNDVIKNAKSSLALKSVDNGLEIILKNFQAIIEEKSDNLLKIKEQRQDIKEAVHTTRELLNHHLDVLERDILSKLSTESDKNEKHLDELICDMKEKEIQTREIHQNLRKMISFASDLQTFLGINELESQVQEKLKFFEDVHSSDVLNNITMKWQTTEITKNLKESIPPFINISTDESQTKVAIVRPYITQAQMVQPETKRIVRKYRDQTQHEATYRALHNYVAEKEDELTFNKGDIFIVLDNTNMERWFARKLDFEAQIYLEGYIPHVFVQKENPFYSYEWYFGTMSRKVSEQLLLSDWNDIGSYMVTSDTQQKVYDLSVLSRKGLGRKVKHYEIVMREDRKFEISYSNTTRKFSTLPNVICYFTHSANKLCQRLVKPCQRSSKKWEIPQETLQLLTRISKCGPDREIWKGKWNKTVHVAISKYKPGPEVEIEFLSQQSILKLCHHDHIVQLFGVCSDAGRYIVTQLASKGSLLDYLRSDEGAKYKFAELVNIATQVANGLAYLELNNIIHRDVAARSVYLTHHLVAKLGNFTRARFLEDDKSNQKRIENIAIKWTAPEAALYGQFTTKSDVWSYGILLVELVTHGQIPYPGMQNREVLEQIKIGYRIRKPLKCPDPMYGIMQNCWEKDPSKRPTFESLFSTMDDYLVSAEQYYDEKDEDENCNS